MLLDSWDWILYSALGGAMKLASLPWWCSRMGHKACTAHCLGTWIRQECALKVQATSLALQTGKVTGCALCSTATVNGAVGWVMQFPVCSGKAPWSGRLMHVFSNKWGYRWVSLLRHRGRSSSKVTNAVCSWSQVNLCPRFPGQTGPLALLSGQSALPTRFSAQALLGYAASRCSHHPSLSGGALCLRPGEDWEGPFQAAPKSSWTGFLVSRGQEPQFTAEAPWLSSSAWAWADWTPGPAARPLGSPS